MSLPQHQDARGRAELLTFLVISQLATMHAMGQWMSVENVVESTLYWRGRERPDFDVVQRAMLGSRALPLAKAIDAEHSIVMNGSMLATVFDSDLRLNFACVTTRKIYERCELLLMMKARRYA